MYGTVVVKGSQGAGLGDRIQSVISGIALAKLTDRQLFVDWSDGTYGQFGRNVFSDLFQLRGLSTPPTLPESGSISPAAWRGNLHLSMGELYQQDGCPPWDHMAAVERYSTNLSTLEHPEEILVLFDSLQFRKMRQELASKLGITLELSDWQAMGSLLREHLFLQPPVVAAIDKFVATHLQHRPTIGVHVRLTHEAVAQKGSVAVRRYFPSIDKILKNHGGGTVFLSTDNADVKADFSARYRNCVSREQWFAVPGDPLHLNPNCPDKFRHAFDALVDMFLLARCDYLLRSGNSAFSIVSSLAAGLHADHEIVLGPDRRSVLGRFNSIGKRLLARILNGE